MTPESIRTLFDYSGWAFERVWACVLQLTDDQFVQPIAAGEWSIRDHSVHLSGSMIRIMARSQAVEPPPQLAFEDYPTPASARAKWDETHAVLLEYIGSLDQSQFDEVVEWAIPTRGIRCACPRWAILLHLANHATDHHAQILTLLRREFGIATVEQDLILYLVERSAG